MDRGLKAVFFSCLNFRFWVSILILMDRGLKESIRLFIGLVLKLFQSLFLWTEDLKLLHFLIISLPICVSILILMDRGLKDETFKFAIIDGIPFQSLFLWTEDLKKELIPDVVNEIKQFQSLFLWTEDLKRWFEIFISLENLRFNPYSYGQRT